MIIIEKNEDDIFRYEQFWEPLVYPEYITLGYAFDELYIEKWMSGISVANYFYKKEDDIIAITMNPSIEMYNNILWLTTDDVRNGTCEYKTWYDKDTKNNGIDVIFDNISITVRGKVEVSELKKIVNGLKEK